MKKILLFAFIINICLLSNSCSKNETSSNTNSGDWSGSLVGDINGTWSGKITSNGAFSGKVITTQSSPDHDFILAGQVSQTGNLVGTMKNSTYNINIDFTGNFQNSSCNGAWVFNGAGMHGTWTGTKQ